MINKIEITLNVTKIDFWVKKIMLSFNEGGPETVKMNCRRMREPEMPEQARVACFMAGDHRHENHRRSMRV